MMNLTLIIFLLLPFRLFSQADTPKVIAIQFDTTWNHHILESDLILYVEIDNAVFVTQAGSFSGKILQVVKGEFNDSAFGINLDLIELSRKRWDERLLAICPPFDKMKFPYRCYAGFVKHGPYYNFITDPKTKQKYYFFMSEKDMKTELRNYYFKRFWTKKLLPLYFRLTGNE